jgi:hypothetical protein
MEKPMTEDWIRARTEKVKVAIHEQRVLEEERRQRDEAIRELAPRAWDDFSTSVTRLVDRFNEEFDEYHEVRIDYFEKLPTSHMEIRRTKNPPIAVIANLHKDGQTIQYKVKKGQSELEGTLSFDLKDGQIAFSDSRSLEQSGCADDVARTLIDPFFDFGGFKF